MARAVNYYGDHDRHVAVWLRNLIAAGLVPPGDVDERNIEEVTAGDLKGYTQCHFFAGIGGWPLALHLAGWPASKPVWTGSCPCQPYSAAGKRKGDDDPRNVWPHFRRLIAECRPATVFGEQVDGNDGLRWLAGVHADLEALEYAVGTVALPAAGVGAPHIRSRLFWVAYGTGERWDGGENPARASGGHGAQDGSPPDGVADAKGIRRGVRQPYDKRQASGEVHAPANAGDCGDTRDGQGGVADAKGAGLSPRGERPVQPLAGAASPWDDSILIPCADGKVRRISAEPALFPLAARLSSDLVRLRGAGNSIVPQVAAAFVAAYMEWKEAR